MSCISVVYAEKDNKEEATQEIVATEKEEKPEKTTAKKTTENKEDETKPSKTTEKTTEKEEEEKTTEKSEEDTKPTKTTEKTTEKEPEKETEEVETTEEDTTEKAEDEEYTKPTSTTKSVEKTTARKTIGMTMPTATLRKDDEEPLNDVEDYVAQDSDLYLDFRNEPNSTGGIGYFGPEFSDEGAGSMSPETALVIKATDGGIVGIDFSENELKSYKYAFIKIKSSDKNKAVKMTLKIGDATISLDNWKISNGSKFPRNLDTEYKTYALDLRANGVTNLITHSTDATEVIADKTSDYDICFIADGADGADITIESIIFTDDKPVYKTKKVSAKKSLLKKIALPVLLIVISAVTLFVVNFIIYKRNQHNDNMVKRSKRNTGYKKR